MHRAFVWLALFAACDRDESMMTIESLEARTGAIEKVFDAPDPSIRLHAATPEIEALKQHQTEILAAISEIEASLAAMQLIETPAEALTVGIPACDRFFAAYAKCIDEHVPESIRDGMRESLPKMVETMRDVAKKGDIETVSEICTDLQDDIRSGTEHFGCKF
jgi:hypothetical protein